MPVTWPAPVPPGLYAGLAQTLAADGRRAEAIAALGQVADITERLPADVVADADSMFGWSEVRLRHTESYVYTALGDTARAYAAQDQALALYPDALARERAAMLLHRATCMIREGDVGGGLAYVGTVLDDLPAEQHTDSSAPSPEPSAARRTRRPTGSAAAASQRWTAAVRTVTNLYCVFARAPRRRLIRTAAAAAHATTTIAAMM